MAYERKPNFNGRPNFRNRPKLSKAERAKMIEERLKQQHIEEMEKWKPKTKLGVLVKSGKIKDIDDALKHKILEQYIVDSLLILKSDILNIGQAKGKFGGGKRRAWRQTQKKTKEGNVPTFACMAVVGNEKGYIGLGSGKAKETLPARSKAIRNAKLNIQKIKRGCASFDCVCGEPHTVPFIVEGKSGSCKVKLMPAAQGTGLVAGDELKKILKLAGIEDVYSVTTGKIRTTFNLAKACVNALEKTNLM
jgi:small subunit ribosomal protein S5